MGENRISATKQNKVLKIRNQSIVCLLSIVFAVHLNDISCQY